MRGQRARKTTFLIFKPNKRQRDKQSVVSVSWGDSWRIYRLLRHFWFRFGVKGQTSLLGPFLRSHDSRSSQSEAFPSSRAERTSALPDPCLAQPKWGALIRVGPSEVGGFLSEVQPGGLKAGRVQLHVLGPSEEPRTALRGSRGLYNTGITPVITAPLGLGDVALG